MTHALTSDYRIGILSTGKKPNMAELITSIKAA